MYKIALYIKKMFDPKVNKYILPFIKQNLPLKIQPIMVMVTIYQKD